MGTRGNKKAKKEEDYTEKLEKEIRELKSINRSLMKQLKKLSKGINREEFEEALEEKVITRGKKKEESDRGEPRCPECSRAGEFREITIAGRRFERCEHCGYKSRRLK